MGNKDDQLPDAVPPDNSARTRAAFGAANADGASLATIPDMATPNFARPDFDQASARTVRERHEVHERVVESDEEGEADADDARDTKPDDLPDMRRPFLLLIAIVVLLGALGAIVLTQNRQTTPLCSTQPAWNQYNCLPG